MIIEETELDKIRYEDLAPSLQKMIDNLILNDDEEYINLRTNVANISSQVDTFSKVYCGSDIPKSVSLGRTVYFDTINSNVRISDYQGGWTYLN